MEKKMENEMETGLYIVSIRFVHIIYACCFHPEPSTLNEALDEVEVIKQFKLGSQASTMPHWHHQLSGVAWPLAFGDRGLGIAESGFKIIVHLR